MGRKFSEYTGITSKGKLKVECWHVVKNGDVNPIDVSYANGNKYWFQCDVCPHSFNSSIYNITKDNGTWCPYCTNQKNCGEDNCKFCYDKSFKSYKGKTTNGNLKVECWHPNENEDVNPRDVAISSGKKYWFQCDKCPHSFNSLISGITGRDHWCPYCAGNKICGEDECNICYEKSFKSYIEKTTNGNLKCDCWHLTKNGTIKPIDVSYSNGNKYWFQCDVCPHSFNSSISNITKNNGSWCSYCSGRNICGKDDCDFCYEKSFKSYPEKTINGNLKVECWHPTKNGDTNPIDISYANGKKHWFQCDECPHSFNSSISGITRDDGSWCPYCSVPCQKMCNETDCDFCYKKSFKSYIEKTKNNKLKVECWHPTKNGDTNPRDIMRCTPKKYWFQCDVCLHSFNSEISSITGREHWCPYCVVPSKKDCGKDDCDFCYEKSFKSYPEKTKNNKLKVECWHPTKNGDTQPRDIAISCNKKYWFKCDVCPHPFNSLINGITNDNGIWCPYCCHNPKMCNELDCDFCYNNSFASYTGITTNGKLKVECWHLTKNGDVNPRDVSYSNGNKYWFQCDDDKCKKSDFNSKINHITSSNGSWCSGCASSKGEKLLTKIIKELIKLIKEFGYPEDLEKSYPDCKDIRVLPFDRCILIDGFPDVLFEYDGIQHFETVEFYGGEDRFILRKKHDIIKNKYCVDNNKVLVRIDHTMDLNIEAPIKQLMEDGIKMSMENKSGIIFSNPELYQECYGDEYII
jgi:hypothetical protein